MGGTFSEEFRKTGLWAFGPDKGCVGLDHSFNDGTPVQIVDGGEVKKISVGEGGENSFSGRPMPARTQKELVSEGE